MTRNINHKRYCANIKLGKLDPYEGLKPDDFTDWEVRREKAEFERSATQKSTITSIMANRFHRAAFKDSDQNVELAKTKEEKRQQEKTDAVKMNFFGPITHNLYDWYPNKLVCRRFNVPEPYPGSKKEGCPLLDMEKESKEKDMSDSTIQSIFGATEEDVQKFAQIDKFDEPRKGSQYEKF